MNLLTIRDLTTEFHTKEGDIKACDHISLNIGNQKSLGIIGETGCGKSVLGMSVLQLLPGNVSISGEIIYRDRDLLTLPADHLQKLRGNEIALLPQSPATSLNPVTQIGRQIAEGLKYHRGIKRGEAQRQAVEMLRDLHLPSPEKTIRQYPHQLSGGMKQRVLAAISITGNPSLLIADEPTKGLDAILRAQVVELIKQLIEDTGASLLLITHDLKVAAYLCDEIAVMYAGQIVEQGPARQVLERPQHCYTQGLLASLPDKGLHPIPGSSPSLLNCEIGCRFYQRCPRKEAACCQTQVALQNFNGTYVRCLNIA